MDLAGRTRWICEQAREVGFDLCGVAPADAFPELAQISTWAERGHAGEMNYLRDERRVDPRLALAGARSLIVVALNYHSLQPYSTEQAGVHDDDSPRGCMRSGLSLLRRALTRIRGRWSSGWRQNMRGSDGWRKIPA